MTLPEFLEAKGIDPTFAMNLLQDNGIVSDNAVFVTDLDASDQRRAVAWLSNEMQGPDW